MKRYVQRLPLILLFSLSACDAKVDKNIENIHVKQTKTYVDTFNNTHTAWKQKEGQWVFENNELIQKATDKYYPLMILEKEQYSDVDVSVDFKPLTGSIDASGGVVFRAVDAENYYIVRANGLEDNFRLYYFKNGSRYEIASATVTPPALNVYSTIRVVAKGNHIQAYLNGKLYIDHHDTLYSKGYVGLWTKADSVTAFDNFKVSGE